MDASLWRKELLAELSNNLVDTRPQSIYLQYAGLGSSSPSPTPVAPAPLLRYNSSVNLREQGQDRRRSGFQQEDSYAFDEGGNMDFAEKRLAKYENEEEGSSVASSSEFESSDLPDISSDDSEEVSVTFSPEAPRASLPPPFPNLPPPSSTSSASSRTLSSLQVEILSLVQSCKYKYSCKSI